MGRKLKILAITASTNGQYKDDTDVLIEGLTDLGNWSEILEYPNNTISLIDTNFDCESLRQTICREKTK